LKRPTIILACLLAALTAGAQDEADVYQMEMGGALGMDFYLGDANKTPFRHSSAMGGFIVRRMFNPRMALKADLTMGHLTGNTKGRYFPTDASSKTAEGGVPVSFKFKRNVVDLGAQFEFNFWGFSMGESYKGNSRITPYALAGVGLTLATGGGGGTKVALNCPVGVGVKYKLKQRLNVGAEWTFRFTTTDALDTAKEWKQLSMPSAIQSSGFKNKDCYSYLMFFVTYEMMPKCKTCHNNN
jgi:opacity protein-like surface antigen